MSRFAFSCAGLRRQRSVRRPAAARVGQHQRVAHLLRLPTRHLSRGWQTHELCRGMRPRSLEMFCTRAAAGHRERDSADQVLLKRSQAARAVDAESARGEGGRRHFVGGWRTRLRKGRSYDSLG